MGWLVQPSRPVPIDWGHPLAADLRFFVAFFDGQPVDYVTCATGTPNGAPSVESWGNATAAKLDSAGGDYYTWADNDHHDIVGEITLAWRGSIATGVAYRHFAGKTTSSGLTNTPFDFRTDTAPSPVPTMVRSSASAYGVWVASSGISVGATAVHTVEYTQGATLNLTPSFYVDGGAGGSSTLAAGPSSAAAGSTTGLYVGRRPDGATVQHDGFTEYAVGWARVLTPEELSVFRNAPYALFARSSGKLISIPSSGTLIVISDSGSGSDGLGIAASVSVADTGSGADVVASIAAALGIADSGSGTDALGIAVSVALADTGTGIDGFAGTASVVLADSGSGADDQVVTVTLPEITDTGTGNDSISVLTEQLIAIADAATGTDSVSVQVTVSVGDTGSGADGLGLMTDVLKSVADSGAATDNVSVSVSVGISDSGSGLDLLGITTLLAVLDLGTGYDVVVASTPGAAKIATITFNARSRSVALDMRGRSAVVGMAGRTVTIDMRT